jgi:hypothetical protein
MEKSLILTFEKNLQRDIDIAHGVFPAIFLMFASQKAIVSILLLFKFLFVLTFI